MNGWPTRLPGHPGYWSTNLANPAPAPACPIHGALRGGYCPACANTTTTTAALADDTTRKA